MRLLHCLQLLLGGGAKKGGGVMRLSVDTKNTEKQIHHCVDFAGHSAMCVCFFSGNLHQSTNPWKCVFCPQAW